MILSGVSHTFLVTEHFGSVEVVCCTCITPVTIQPPNTPKNTRPSSPEERVLRAPTLQQHFFGV